MFGEREKGSQQKLFYPFRPPQPPQISSRDAVLFNQSGRTTVRQPTPRPRHGSVKRHYTAPSSGEGRTVSASATWEMTETSVNAPLYRSLSGPLTVESTHTIRSHNKCNRHLFVPTATMLHNKAFVLLLFNPARLFCRTIQYILCKQQQP